jgi:putative membrane protein
MTDEPEPAHQLKRSAEAVENSAEDLTDSADRRTILAGDRTLFAAERTYAAWMRTGLAALASGVGARALLEGSMPDVMLRITASVLAAFAALCFVAAVWRHFQDGLPPPKTTAKPFPHALLVPINLFLVIVVLLVIVGLWTS